jgi:LytS/YehU family sensor histidine kinase
MRPPFLSWKAFWGLLATGPLITLVTQPLEGVASPLHSLKCFTATALTLGVTGLCMQGFVNGVLRRGAGRSALIAAVAGAQLIAVGLVLLIVPRLGAFEMTIPPNLAVFVVHGGVAIAAVYLVAARAVTLLGERAKLSRTEVLRNRVLALQSQMNPHFLFNTLNSIAALIQLEPELAESMVERLAGVLQYAVSAGQKSSVKLKEELDVLRDYLSIEQARYGPRLKSSFDVAPELLDQPLPPMLLQPLVENAVLHGLAPRENGGEVKISGRVEGDVVVVTIADDGIGFGASKRQGSRVGLTSVRERMALAFGDAGALDVRQRPGGGCECELRIPRVAAA